MARALLMISWEYPGVSSKQGTALSRRVGQVAEDFIRNGWQVTVIHKDQIGELQQDEKYKVFSSSKTLTRIAVADHKKDFWNTISAVSVFRKMITILFALLYGDRSYSWAKRVIRIFPVVLNKTTYKPDLIITFFTPRAPMVVGKYAANYYGAKWIADFQDTFDEGYKKELWPIVGRWSRRVLSSAHKITHVSPEWALRDGKFLQREIVSIRHAVPLSSGKKPEQTQQKNEAFTILYAGSIDVKNMSADLFADIFNEVIASGYPLKLQLAGSEYLYEFFKQKINAHDALEYLGWLSPEELSDRIVSSHLLLVIPWSAGPRQVIPSKFFEYLSFDKPIWVVGPDTGSFAMLFKEYEMNDLRIDDRTFQKELLLQAVQGDFTRLDYAPYKRKFLREDQLYAMFLKGVLHD